MTKVWIAMPGKDRSGDLHRGLVGAMTGLNRRLRGISALDWAAMANLSLREVRKAETGQAMTLGTAARLLKAAQLDRARFTRAVLEPCLVNPLDARITRRRGRIAAISAMEAMG